MSFVQTDLVGAFVKIPDEGDQGVVRAVWTWNATLYVAVQRDNPSRDIRVYVSSDVSILEVK